MQNGTYYVDATGWGDTFYVVLKENDATLTDEKTCEVSIIPRSEGERIIKTALGKVNKLE